MRLFSANKCNNLILKILHNVQFVQSYAKTIKIILQIFWNNIKKGFHQNWYVRYLAMNNELFKHLNLL